MRRRAALLAISALAAACAGCAPPRRRGDHGGWVALIDGAAGLENFARVGDANWRPHDGAIHADRGSGYLVSREIYADFELRAEFWASADANSGVFLRVQDPRNITPQTSYEVNIFDARPDPSYGTGAIVGFAKVSPMPRAAGRWNTYQITAEGPHVVAVLNGRKTAELRDASFLRGPIALQSAGGTIRFRKLAIRL